MPSTLRAAEQAIEGSPLNSAAKGELPAGAESIRERALSDGDSALPMRILAEWRSRVIAEMTESRRSRTEIGTAIRAIAEPKNLVLLYVTHFKKDFSNSNTGRGGSRGTDAAVDAAASIMSKRFAESARKAAKEEHTGESLAWVAGDLLCRPAPLSR